MAGLAHALRIINLTWNAFPIFCPSTQATQAPPPGYLCKICQVSGHWIQDCPTRARPAGLEPGKVCFDFTKGRCARGAQCRYSHDAATIAAHQAEARGGPRGDYLCNICRVPGHWIQDCPQRGAGPYARHTAATAVARPGLGFHDMVHRGNAAAVAGGGSDDSGGGPGNSACASISAGFPRQPPAGYMCSLCLVPGHWIQDCPQAGGGGCMPDDKRREAPPGRVQSGDDEKFAGPRVNTDGTRVIICNGREIVVEAETDEEKKRREEGLKLLHRVDSKKVPTAEEINTATGVGERRESVAMGTYDPAAAAVASNTAAAAAKDLPPALAAARAAAAAVAQRMLGAAAPSVPATGLATALPSTVAAPASANPIAAAQAAAAAIAARIAGN